MYLNPFYSADCSLCLHGVEHSIRQHEDHLKTALELDDINDLPDDEDSEMVEAAIHDPVSRECPECGVCLTVNEWPMGESCPVCYPYSDFDY